MFYDADPNIFVVRPMSGVSASDDDRLVADVKMALSKDRNKNEVYTLLNSYIGTPYPLYTPVHVGCIWKLGSAIRQLEFADIIVLVKDSWKTAKGCAIERRVIEQYFDIYEDHWTVYVFDPKTKSLTDVTNDLKAAHMGIKVN